MSFCADLPGLINRAGLGAVDELAESVGTEGSVRESDEHRSLTLPYAFNRGREGKAPAAPPLAKIRCVTPNSAELGPGGRIIKLLHR